MVDTYGVSASDVIDALPVDASEITSTSKPLTVDNIGQYIDRGASAVLNQLQNAGVPLSEDQATIQQCRTAIIAFAVMECMQKMGMLGTQAYRDARDQWDSFHTAMQTSVNINARSENRTQSTSIGKTGGPSFSGRNYRGF